MVSTVVAVVLIAIGLYMKAFRRPTDYKQGEGYRIIFVHVPASWMSMFIYLVMAGWAALGLVFNTRLSAMMAQALAPTGAMFAPSCRCGPVRSGASRCRGTWWVWDARITSELILLFLYLGYMALRSGDRRPAPRRPCKRDPALLGRRGQRANHLLLGEMVEHAAPGLHHPAK